MRRRVQFILSHCRRILGLFRYIHPVASEGIWKWEDIRERGWQGPEGLQLETWRAEAGVGFLGRPSTPAGVSGECCKLPQWGSERSLGRLIVLVYFRCWRWLLLLHFQVYFERKQQAVYTLHNGKTVDTALHANKLVSCSFLKRKRRNVERWKQWRLSPWI